jgi:hypothetical protein
MKGASTIAIDHIGPRILLIRGVRVLLDADLAQLYGTSTRALNQAVKRNTKRFPGDFMFHLTPEEKSEVITQCDHLQRLKFSAQLPWAFTEHGAIMVAAVLNTARAIEISVHVVRTFVQLREMIAAHKGLAERLARLEETTEDHTEAIRSLMTAIRQLMTPPEPKRRGIGFRGAE